MPIEKKTRPYEFLVRWGQGGAITGAHVQMIEEVIEDGTVLAAKIQDAQPVALAGSIGFPLEQVLSAAHRDALATAGAKSAEAAGLAKALRIAEGGKENADATVASLTDQLARANDDLARAQDALSAERPADRDGAA